MKTQHSTTRSNDNQEADAALYHDLQNNIVDSNGGDSIEMNESFLTASSSMLPLSIDDNDTNQHHQHQHHRYHPISPRRRSRLTPHLFTTHPHLAVLPVLLLEFLALALTRAVLPSLLLQRYGSDTYVVMGMAECLRGVLAFFACPIFGKLSDVWGRKVCLLITVAGTLGPVCSLAFWRVEDYDDGGGSHYRMGDESYVVDGTSGEALMMDGVDATSASEGSYSAQFGMRYQSHIHRIDVFVTLLALSGMFSSTFTLTFAYISDVIKDRDGRVAAYGLALATFGLSFTIGPLLGGYLANVDDEGKGRGGRNWMNVLNFNEEDSDAEEAGKHIQHHSSKSSEIHPLGQHRVFLTTLVLALLDLLYIYFILPESLSEKRNQWEHTSGLNISIDCRDNDDEHNNQSSTAVAATSSESNVPLPAGMGVSRRASSSWWNPFDSIRYLTSDPLLSIIGRVTFLYYTALHAVVSTLVLYAARQFHLGPHRLGELMAALGLSTMLSEAVLVRVAIPALGEKRAMRVGLASFAMQCVLLAVADSPWHLFACAALAIPGNLVYPSVSSLVSATVRPDMVGRALGAMNGVKSLTEGVGPLVFGTLLTMSEKDNLPGWPYFIAAVMAAMAFHAGSALPSVDQEDILYKGGMEYKYNINLREEEEVNLLERNVGIKKGSKRQI
ncbi:hypothetical protein HJC23_008937 [Cyclotella cryptica]|uniref:Major facilitator superfamily (MFS) profile domain-containing protein n=1 Tax=Cyclotella cryptica TaxID=29204 RepID=A0ABD3Q0T7_9STRA